MMSVQHTLPSEYTSANAVIIEQVNSMVGNESRFYAYPSDYPAQKKGNIVALFHVRLKAERKIEAQEKADHEKHLQYMSGETIDLSEVDYQKQIQDELK